MRVGRHGSGVMSPDWCGFSKLGRFVRYLSKSVMTGIFPAAKIALERIATSVVFVGLDRTVLCTRQDAAAAQATAETAADRLHAAGVVATARNATAEAGDVRNACVITQGSEIGTCFLRMQFEIRFIQDEPIRMMSAPLRHRASAVPPKPGVRFYYPKA